MSAKEMQHPPKSASGPGSLRLGMRHWWHQRISALVLLVTGLWFVVTVLCLLHADFATARATVAHPWHALLLVLFMVAAFWHAALGLQVVIEDYVHTRWKEVLLRVVVGFLAILGALTSVMAVLRIAWGV